MGTFGVFDGFKYQFHTMKCE